MKGLIHVYTGNGKGKTTAALGLAVRAAGRGRRVLIVQFFKGRSSGELAAFERIPGVRVLRPEKDRGFFFAMSDEDKRLIRAEHDALLSEACAQAEAGGCDLLILDEAASAFRCGAVDAEKLERFIKNKPDQLELVLTGRDAPPAFTDAADYVTEMRCVKHPYEKGIAAREGIEF